MQNTPLTCTSINLEEVSVLAKLPAHKTYLRLPERCEGDKYEDATIEVCRDGDSVSVYVADDGGFAYVDDNDLSQLTTALQKARADASIFLEALVKYSRFKQQKLECQFIGHQVRAEYEFSKYLVAFEHCYKEKERTCDIFVRENQKLRLVAHSSRPYEGCGMTVQEAEQELKVYLLNEANKETKA